MVVWLLRQKRLLPFALSDANVTENMTETNLNTVVLAKATVDYINYLTAKYLQAVARTATTCDFKSEKIFVKNTFDHKSFSGSAKHKETLLRKKRIGPI